MANIPSNTSEKGFLWQSQSSFLLIMMGATISMRDLTAFPALVGENGGSAFILIYVLFLFLLSFPLLVSELFLGRFSQSKQINAFLSFSSQFNVSAHWHWVARLAIFAALLLLALYCIVAGWSVSSAVKVGLGLFEGQTQFSIKKMLIDFQTDPEKMMLWHTLFILVLVMVSTQGLKNGLERFIKWLVPLTAILLLVGISYAFTFGEYTQSVNYLLSADFSKLDLNVALLALERAFFTLSVGLGVYLVIGSFMPKSVHIFYSSTLIIVVDLLFSIITGLALHALIFTSQTITSIDTESVFTVLPLIFSSLPYGQFFGFLFYLLLCIVAFTTAITLLEVLVSYVQQKLNYSRIKAVVVPAMIIWVIGVFAIFSYTIWADSGLTLELYISGDAVRLAHNAGFQDALIYIASHVLQPLISLMIIIYIAWVVDHSLFYELLGIKDSQWTHAFFYMIRFITPSLLLIVWFSSLGIIG